MNARTHHHLHDDREEIVMRELRMRGYRITAPRRAIIEALGTASAPKTAKEIASRTNIKDASTVYRTLAELVKEGFAEEFQDRGVARFELMHQHHDHAVCDRCGAIEHIPCESKATPRTLKEAGWKVVSHEILYRGICAACLTKDSAV